MSMSMFHHEQIMDAICNTCGGWMPLTADAGGSEVVEVGGNGLFRPGSVVVLSDSETAAETHVVEELRGQTEVVLSGQVGGTYLVERQARMALSGHGPVLAWVGRGWPELGPRPAGTHLPCAVVEPLGLEQPLEGGTNQAVAQEYRTRVYYLRRRQAGEEGDAALVQEVGGLFNRLMADPTLGGTCWHAQVTRVDYSPITEKALREQGAPVRTASLDVVARRLEARVAG